MFEYHGWLTLRVLSTEVENEDKLIWNAHTFIQKTISLLNHCNRCIDLRVMNGEHFLYIAGHSNHAQQEEKELLNLVNSINEIAPRTYGLIYIRDDEDTFGFSNDFQILRIVRGKVEKFKDNLLSPCIPTIEDS